MKNDVAITGGQLMGTSLWVARVRFQRAIVAIFPTAMFMIVLGLDGRHNTLLAIGFILLVLAFGALGYVVRPVRGPVTIDDESVHNDKITIVRSAIRGGYYTPPAGNIEAAVVLIGEKKRALGKIGVSGTEEARRILTTLGLGADRVTVTFDGFPTTPSRAWRRALVVIFGVALPAATTIGSLAPPATWPAMFGLLVAMAALLYFGGARFEVGADGLTIRDRVRSRFVPWADVSAVCASPRGVTITVGHERIELPFTRLKTLVYATELAKQRAMLTRIEDALGSYRAVVVPDVSARVARGSRSRSGWLRDLFDREATFRSAPVRDEELWQVLESAAAEESARAGAAVVLARTGSDADRVRLRIAADACAAPKLRVVLDKAARGRLTELAEIERALDDLEDGEGEAVARRS